MKLLAVDTSTEVCSICMLDSGRVVGEYVSCSSRTHTERLLPAVELMMNHLEWTPEDLNALAVIHGPGSFTGLRISLSVIKGLAFAGDLPVVALNALEVAAHQVDAEGWICPAMDARRKEIFTCLFERTGGELKTIGEPQSVSPEVWREQLPDAPVLFCGPGAALYLDVLKKHSESRLAFRDFVLARKLAELASSRVGEGAFIDGAQLKAAYLRPSDAEVKGPHAVRRKLRKGRIKP